MASKSKNKGKGFEREMANFLSDLYQLSFIRVPASGAFVGGANAVRKDILSEGQIRGAKSDIIPPDTWNHFNMECKNYSEFPFHQLVWNKPVLKLDEWLEQTLDSAQDKDFNILAMKFNRKGRYVCFETKLTAPERQVRLTMGSHVLYTHNKSNTHWVFTEFDSFWQLNKSQVAQLSTQGI